MSSADLQDIPTGDVQDNSYISRSGHKNEPLPVQADSDNVNDPINPNTADTDEQLERDDAEAIDQNNIIKDRTRHAQPSSGYREPGDEEGLPANDGTSSADQINNPLKNARASK